MLNQKQTKDALGGFDIDYILTMRIGKNNTQITQVILLRGVKNIRILIGVMLRPLWLMW